MYRYKCFEYKNNVPLVYHSYLAENSISVLNKIPKIPEYLLLADVLRYKLKTRKVTNYDIIYAYIFMGV